MTLQTFLFDFGTASAMILVCQLLRSKCRLFQNLLMPAPLIGGIIALLAGDQVLGIYHYDLDAYASYTSVLVTLLFAGLFIGNKKNKNLKKQLAAVGDSFLINTGNEFAQFGLSILIGSIILICFFPDMAPEFSMLMPSGFVGGHGYGYIVGSQLERYGIYENGVDLAFTFATIGMLLSVLGGLILVNYGVRKGYARYIPRVSELPQFMRTGFYDLDDVSVGKQTTSSISVETFTFHFAFVVLAAALAYKLDSIISGETGLNLPVNCMAMMIGVLLNGLSGMLSFDRFIDKKIISRIGGSATDYLVFFGIASVKISVVAKYWKPILLFTLLGIAYVLAYLFFVSKKLFRENWFENGMFIFGWSTGIVSMGTLLLRIVDPESLSGVLENYSVAYTVLSFVEMALITIVPIVVCQGGWLICSLILLALFAVTMAAAALLKKKT